MLRRTLALCLMLTVATGAGWAMTRNVPSAAYPTIQSAINLARNGDVVVVALGTYKENIDFKGKRIIVQSSNPTSAAVVAATIIDGDQKGSVVTFKSGETAASVLNGFTITNGSGIGEYNDMLDEYSYLGGGIYCLNSAPTIRNNFISGNSLTGTFGGGSGVCCDGASPTITNNTISNNRAAFGAGVICLSSSPVIANNTIANNSASANGGGMRCEGYSSPILTNNTISGNSAANGGGVYHYAGGCATLISNVIRGNTATAEYQFGGGGGIKLHDDGEVILIGNTISGNSGKCGGGVDMGSGRATMINNTISGNSAEEGGGVYCGRSATLTNNTISGNFASRGGGVYCFGDDVATIQNTIIAFNTGGGLYARVPENPLWFSGPVITYCDVYGNTGGDYVNWPSQTGTSGNLSVDPRFASAASGKFALKSKAGRWNGTVWVNDTLTSPCIDAGDPGSEFVKEPTPNGGRVNMGFDGNTAYASKSGPPTGPTAPTAVAIAPTAPGPEDLVGTASGSTCAAGRTITYRYHWARRKADGTWEAWSYTGQTLPAARVKIGETWRVRAQASDGVTTSAWKIGSSATIVSMAGLTPAPKTYGVPVTTCVFASFRWPVQQASVTTRVQLKRGTTVVPAVMTWVTAERKVKLRPKAALLPDTYYRINLDPGIVCVGGRTLGWGENYWFKTAPAAAAAAVSVAAAPTAAGAQVTVNLSSAATVRTVICNIAGRVVAELGERDLPAGLTSLAWNGKGGSGTRVPAGTYLVRVEAKG
ncbi:MAG: right-handed parallel beta-helix repeat-containing protein, partial [Armatimonadia bacterium]